MTHPVCEQTSLHLFEPPTFDAVCAANGVSGLTVVFNPRLKRGWRLTVNTLFGRRTLTIPEYFRPAPEHVKRALLAWAALPVRGRKKNAAAAEKKHLEHLIWEYARTHGNCSERVRRIDTATYITAGRVFDLAEVFASLNRHYFNDALTSYLRWNKSFRRSYQTFFIDAQGRRHSLISIAHAYNRPDVPRFAIEGIVYHEMLHIAVPPARNGDRNIIHGAAFRAAERRFEHFRQWRMWEKNYFGGRIRPLRLVP